MDVLSDVVAAMRTGRPHSARRDKYAPWGLRFAATDEAGFHVVLRGSAWLIPEDGEPVALAPGDVVFLAHGQRHALASALDVPLREVRLLPDGTWIGPPDSGEPRSDCPDTVTVCGTYRLDRERAHRFLAELPEVMHLPARVGSHRSLRAAVELLGMELEELRPGTDAIVTSLLDTLLLYILRAWWESERAAGRAGGWASALADPAVAAALRAVHGDPARAWTVAELAAAGGLSRAAFARRFSTLVGEPPLTYLTWWRMTVAGRLLRHDDLTMRQVAGRTGYTSEFAFAKAFKREYGVAPGQYRRGAARAHRTDPDVRSRA
ncbi:AraC-like DNA-binding protein [Streptomyces griseochromogenes]|uniref:AraC family transcriptional regulator n=1 Tax=Streptomyces griseochromogenes TaxID=68214 RepID=A0A1B1ASS3_9ACTN|nr:AraC family transcriptional regulator [Streptomyces griseochromogenes]ANP49591.1 AraC family transcriptional regulator [Streptomyces griseochromogenes]MBP2051955.1 AraC-like DNA-binding protein [Streptomyces griseochromogenes]